MILRSHWGYALRESGRQSLFHETAVRSGHPQGGGRHLSDVDRCRSRWQPDHHRATEQAARRGRSVAQPAGPTPSPSSVLSHVASRDREEKTVAFKQAFAENDNRFHLQRSLKRMWQAFIVVFREGFESFLIVGIILAYLRRIGQNNLVPAMYWGIGASILASTGM